MNADPRPMFRAWVCLITFDQYSIVNLIDKTPRDYVASWDKLDVVDVKLRYRCAIQVRDQRQLKP